MLADVQRGLERLYRIDTELDVRDFVIDAATRARFGVPRAPREQLLISERDGELRMALFVDPDALDNLTVRDPRRRLDDHNLQDFLLLVEGVSHFVYLAWRARNQRPVSALELELQAEMDKWVTCLLLRLAQPSRSVAPSGAGEPDLVTRLFQRFRLEPDLGPEERQRYLVANGSARAYAERLSARYLARGAVLAMLDELRWFYRLGAHDKLGYIARAA
jgi:hypothetical protein